MAKNKERMKLQAKPSNRTNERNSFQTTNKKNQKLIPINNEEGK